MSFLVFDCRFQYPTGFALNFDFQAEQGITALVGDSGVGKTTTLHLIAGLLRPMEGQIKLGNTTLVSTTKHCCVPPEQRQVGLVFQDYQLFPHLTVEQNLRYGADRRKVTTQTGNQPSWNQLLAVLELEPYLQRYPASLSGGQCQRVALGRAILAQPRILLLDEPFSALDAALRASITNFLRLTLAEFPLPTLLVTHDLACVKSLAQQVIELRK
jgi:molybdate transport system ATP-binding protein